MTPLQSAIAATRAAESDPFDLARVNAMLAVWDRQSGQIFADRFEVISVEEEFSFPLLNPDTGSASRSFDQAGKIDVVVREKSTGRIGFIDHKTTSDDVSPGADYWLKLRMDPQVSKYTLGVMHLYGECDFCWFNVIRKPAQRPSLIPTTDPQGNKVVLDAAGNRVLKKDGTPRQSADKAKGYELQTRPELPGEFEDRLREAMWANPDRHFAHNEVPRLDSELLESMKDDWATSKQMLHYRSNNLWPRNPDSCGDFGGCQYFPLCVGTASVDGVRFGRVDTRHPELEMREEGKSLLTTSRGRTLKRCARLHFLRYEEPVERLGVEESEALRVGTLLHVGMEAYFEGLTAKGQAPAGDNT